MGGFHLKSSRFHVKSKDHLQGIITLCFKNLFAEMKELGLLDLVLQTWEKSAENMELTFSHVQMTNKTTYPLSLTIYHITRKMQGVS